MDARTQDLLRAARADPSEGPLAAALQALRRAGQAVPDDLLAREVYPPRQVAFAGSYKVVAERPSGVWETFGGQKLREVELPEHRVWWVTPQPVALGAEVIEELRELRVPGLTLGRSKEATALVARLDGLPLRWLSLAGCAGCTDATLEALPTCLQLAELDLRGRKVTEHGLKHLLSRAPNLVRLSLDRVRTVKDLGVLSGWPALRRLSLAGISAKALDSLPDLPQLTHLSLYEVGLTAKRLRALAPRLPALREVSIRPSGMPTVTPAHLEATAEFAGLHALTFLASGCSARDLSALSGLAQLRYLDLAPGEADTAALGELSLRDLILRHASTSHLDVLERMPSLRRLSLLSTTGGALGRLGLERVARAPQLEWLEVANYGPPHGWLSNAAALPDSVAIRVDAPRGPEAVLTKAPPGIVPRLHTTDYLLVPPWESPSERQSGPWAIPAPTRLA